jgi:nucleoside-diphosphate-sugar epimerase
MLTKSKLYLNDLKSIQSSIPSLEKLKNQSIVITGACGLICSAIVDFLIQLNDTLNYNIKIYAAVRPQDNIEVRFPHYLKREDFQYIPYDALEPFQNDIHFDYLIHGASNANPVAYMKEPVETMLANFLGLNNILKHAVSHNAKRVLYISTSEVYGNKDNNESYKENNYEFVDILNPRACYPSSKRASETLAVAYSKEYDIETVMVRPGHVYGPTMSPFDTRAASQFAKDVLEGHDIIMKSEGIQLRSHCYVLDCVSAILTVLLNGKDREAYNISNPDSVSTIRQIAEAYAKAGNKKVIFELPSDYEKASYNMMDNSSLDSSHLESIGWKGMFDLEKGTEHTLKILEDIQ